MLLGCLAGMAALTVPTASADIGDRLVMFEKKATLYAGPSSTASRLATLRSGERMVEMERQGAWVFVALKSNGAQGWVRSKVVRKAPARMVRARYKVPARNAAAKKQASTAKKSVKQARVELKAVPEAPIVKPDVPYVTRKVSLKDMGFTKGVMFEGADVHATTFFFPAPMDSHISHGTFRLLFRATSNLHQMANVRVSVNDIPYKQVSMPRDAAMHELDVLLPAAAFKGELVKVTIHAGLPVTENRCFDERLTDIFMHIMPESSLTIAYHPVEESIRDAWRMLPQNVVLSLPVGRLSEDQFASALSIMSLLMDEGKQVRVARLPEIGDIVVASKLAIEGMLNGGQLKTDKGDVVTDMGKALDHVSNLSLVRFPSRAAIVLTDPYDVQPIYLLDDTWEVLAAGDHYRVFRPDNIRSRGGLLGSDGEDGYFSVPLSKLGLDSESKYLKREVSWQTMINPFELPLGTRPDFLTLSVVAPVRWEKDPSYEMYVFLNDVLVKSTRLANTGLKQQFTVDLPEEYQKQFNEIRVVIQHDVEDGNCFGPMPYDYVQLMPDSALVVKQTSGGAPTKFSDLSRYFLSGFDTYLQDSYLDQPEQVLQLIARFAADFPLVVDHSKLHFMKMGELLQPEGPFVAVGRFALGDNVEAPVRFDRGHVKILSPNGETYFDVNQLSGVTIAEIVKASASYGLWVRPSDRSDEPVRERLELAEDDVAFIDSEGVIKTMDSSEPSIAQVYYPDVEDWFDVLGKYRFWLMVLLWFLLTMVVVYLYRMSRANKMAREEDDSQYQTDEELMQGAAAAQMHEDHTLHPGDTLDHLDERR